MKYFAYGSNMNLQQMKKRCPDSSLIGTFFLDDYKIDFTIFSKSRKCGCADVVESKGNKVWGLLYEISESDLKNLDKEEGHPNYYRRFQVIVKNCTGKSEIAECYEVVKKSESFLKPSKHYLSLISDAVENYNFPSEYKNLISRIETLD